MEVVVRLGQGSRAFPLPAWRPPQPWHHPRPFAPPVALMPVGGKSREEGMGRTEPPPPVQEENWFSVGF